MTIKLNDIIDDLNFNTAPTNESEPEKNNYKKHRTQSLMSHTLTPKDFKLNYSKHCMKKNFNVHQKLKQQQTTTNNNSCKQSFLSLEKRQSVSNTNCPSAKSTTLKIFDKHKN